jgi:hypothetical protein
MSQEGGFDRDEMRNLVKYATVSELSRLDLGRWLARMLYRARRDAFESRGPKYPSLRVLSRRLREEHDIHLSPSTLWRLVAVHFQELEICMKPEFLVRLSWRSRVELLRVPRGKKLEWVRLVIKNRWPSRELARQLDAVFPRTPRPRRTPRDRIMKLTNSLARQVAKCPDATPEQRAKLQALLDSFKQTAETLPIPAPPAPPVMKDEESRVKNDAPPPDVLNPQSAIDPPQSEAVFPHPDEPSPATEAPPLKSQPESADT